MYKRQDVDYIVLAPVIETGWDTVLKEAKSVGIPVIIVDRMVDVTAESLYAAWVGTDFKMCIRDSVCPGQFRGAPGRNRHQAGRGSQGKGPGTIASEAEHPGVPSFPGIIGQGYDAA